MSPHAVSERLYVNGVANGVSAQRNTSHMEQYSMTLTNGSATNGLEHECSHLRHTPANDLHDLICVGFGPASLAIAVALHDKLDAELSNPSANVPKVAFLEKQPNFAWHAGMLLHGAKMQISFIKDLASLRDPRSEFTFLNYLHRKNRLVEFTNLNTFLPHRLEYEDYMRWCAGWFDDVVEYGQEVLQVMPEKSYKTGKVESFVVTSRNVRTQEITTRRARHVVIAAGGQPNLPENFPRHPKVLHSSRYANVISTLFPDTQRPFQAAVIGSGQSAAEIFEDLQSHFPNAKTSLLIKGAALRPSDDSPFVNEIFNPSHTDHVFNLDPTTRTASIAADRNTNYGVVRPELIDRLYESLYMQRIRHPCESDWLHRLLPHRTVTSVEDSPIVPGGVRLRVHNESGKFFLGCGSDEEEVMDVDVVFVATGYRRDAHEEMLRDARGLMPKDSRAQGGKWQVRRDYSVVFEEGSVSEDAGIWLQGCNEKTHGLSDTLLSVLATRGGEMVKSIFGDRHKQTNGAAR